MLTERKLVIATGNEGKKREIKEVLKDLSLNVLSTKDFDNIPLIDEDQPTLEGNAEKKARVIHNLLGISALADDTGLEVNALDGRPGVYSARYAGLDANPDANRALLLKELSNQSDRSARFRTVIAYIDKGQLFLFEGICNGHITKSEHGTGGFGYDSIFMPEGSESTFAEMTTEEKNAISHRGKALDKFVQFLSSQSL